MNLLKYKIVAVACLLFLVGLPGCDLINPEEDAPGYLQIDSFQFDPTPMVAEFGPSTSTNIKDVWVYIDTEFQGVYELPAKFPVLKTGDVNVLLVPGIMLNGIAATRSQYPFYQGILKNISLPELGTVKIDPVTSYFESSQCSFCEDFEGSGFSLTTTATSDTIMYQTTVADPNNHEGLCGVVKLDQPNTKFEVTSTTSYDLPGSGAAVYLEFDYKINQVMTAGIFVITPNQTTEQIAIVNLNPTEVWKKVYVQLGYTVSAKPDASGFQVFFGAVKNAAVTEAVFYLDNIKVVHF